MLGASLADRSEVHAIDLLEDVHTDRGYPQTEDRMRFFEIFRNGVTQRGAKGGERRIDSFGVLRTAIDENVEVLCRALWMNRYRRRPTMTDFNEVSASVWSPKPKLQQ